MERTVKDLITNIALKCGVDPTQVAHTIRVNPRGLKIVVDDEVVRELPEGQDMIVEFAEVDTSLAFKKETGSTATTPRAGGTPTNNVTLKVLEMRLVY